MPNVPHIFFYSLTLHTTCYACTSTSETDLILSVFVYNQFASYKFIIYVVTLQFQYYRPSLQNFRRMAAS